MQSPQVEKLSEALAKAQGVMKAAVYNRVNPHFKSRYADLAAVWDAIREPLAKNGLSITQQSEPRDNGNYVLRTVMRHISGQWVASEYPIPTNLKPQELGTWKTYLRRYELSSICGIASDEDNDGEITSKVEDNPLNAEQIEHLQILIDGDSAILDRLLAYVSKLTKQKIERLEQIPQSQFPTSFAALSKKVKAATR